MSTEQILQIADAFYAERDFVRARKGYYVAAARGNAHAQAMMGWLYEKGIGGYQSNNSAVRHYYLASVQGEATARGNLNRIMQTGVVGHFGDPFPPEKPGGEWRCTEVPTGPRACAWDWVPLPENPRSAAIPDQNPGQRREAVRGAPGGGFYTPPPTESESSPFGAMIGNWGLSPSGDAWDFRR